MKQTNNAIKFLMAQYRAIFKNAYFKGLTSAVLLTAGLAVAGGAQAANLDNASKLANAEEPITITGTSSDDGSDGKWANIKLNINASQEWHTAVTISGGTADTGLSGNSIIGNGTLNLSGTGSLTINTNAVANGLYIDNRGSTAADKLTLDINSIAVEKGTLKAVDVSSVKLHKYVTKSIGL